MSIMFSTDTLRPIQLPQVLTGFLWQVVLRELKQNHISYALAECSLFPGVLNGRPVQKLRFLGRDFTAFGAPPLQETLYVYVGPDRRELLVEEERTS